MTYFTVRPKSTVHHKIPVKTKNWTGKCPRQEVCVLLLRLYGDNVKLFPEYELSEEVVPNVDVCRIRRAHRVISQVPCPLVVLKNSDACITKARQNKPLHAPQENHLFDVVCQCYVLGFCGRKRHESVTHFRVLENHHTNAPAHMTAPPETDLISLALLAESASAYATSSSPLPLRKVIPKSLVKKHILQNTNRCLPAYLPGRVGVPGYRSHCVREIRTCLVSKPHQAPCQFVERPVCLRPSSSEFALPGPTHLSPLTANPAKSYQISQYATYISELTRQLFDAGIARTQPRVNPCFRVHRSGR